MSQPIIEVRNLSKRYQLGAIGATSLREEASRLWDRVRGIPHPDAKEFWALRDVSFDIQPGEVVGVIGRNGAGKSTLLKILSRITEPTSGTAKLRGRVASLLEVGTGFHPELTGRENVFLNGAILGMTRAEVRRKFDEIVAFAEVDQFIDTPVKRYSSGMYVRLAFAVAAHLEPEILIVDEVLAVGDAAFQQKCLGKIKAVATGEGRTVLLVSHHMPSVQRLCDRAILLNHGRLSAMDRTESIIPAYLTNAALKGSGFDLTTLPADRRRGTGLARFARIELSNSDGKAASEVRWGEPLRLRFEVNAKMELEHVTLGFSFIAADGTEVMGTSAHDGHAATGLAAGTQVFFCSIQPMILCPGRYYIRAAIFRHGEVFDHIDEMIGFDVINLAFDLSHTPAKHVVGHVYLSYKWSYELGKNPSA